MKTILERLRQVNPSLSLEDARNALGLSKESGFNFLGESVPKQEDGSTVPFEQNIPVDDGQIPPALNPMAIPSALAAPSDVVAANSASPKAIQLSFPEEPIIAERPKLPVLSKPVLPKKQEPVLPKQDKSLEALTQELGAKKEAPVEQQKAGPDVASMLLEAQKRDNESQDIANYLKAANQIGASIAMEKPDVIEQRNKLADSIGAAGQRNVKQLTQQVEFEKQDPNSNYSKKARQFLKDKFNVDLPEGISAAQLDATFMGPALKSFESAENRKAAEARLKADIENKKFLSEENRKSREEIARQSLLMRKDALEDSRLNRQEQAKRKEDNFDQQQVERYDKALQANKEFQEANKALSAISSIRDLADDARKNGGQSLAMLGPKIAKGLAGEVGVLTESDVTRYVKDPSLAGGLKDTLKKLKEGKLSDHSYENLMRLSQIMEAKAKENKLKLIQQQSIKLSRNSGLSKEKARSFLDPEYDPEQPESSSIMSKIPNSEQLVDKYNQVDQMSEEQIDAELKKYGAK